MKYSPTIGLEIHVELNTESKMFCSCLNDPDEGIPNTNICPICTAHPGTLPVINEKAVKQLLKTAIALNCEIGMVNYFERKNYFYPDLPKGYQISQYLLPMSQNGYLDISDKQIRIERIHLEEDTGKLIHPKTENYSLIDYNRAGVPLMELVTHPDIHSASQAREFIKSLQMILRYLDVSKANMEKGEMRCEVNISISDDDQLGTKVEIKNLNSVKSVEKSIEFEIERQREVLENNKKVIQETRGWHDQKEITFSQRKKEEAHDYRYFPEPDLPPLVFSEETLQEIKAEIPELPKERRERMKKEYGLFDKTLELYVSQKDLGEYFESVVSEIKTWAQQKGIKEVGKLIQLASNYITTDLQGLLKGGEFNDDKFKITPENFAEFVCMIYNGEISSKIAKIILKEMFVGGGDPSQIIKEKNLEQIGDEAELEDIIKKVLESNQIPVKEYRAGKETALQFLVGQVMRETRGKANPNKAIEILKKNLA